MVWVVCPVCGRKHRVQKREYEFLKGWYRIYKIKVEDDGVSYLPCKEHSRRVEALAQARREIIDRLEMEKKSRLIELEIEANSLALNSKFHAVNIRRLLSDKRNVLLVYWVCEDWFYVDDRDERKVRDVHAVMRVYNGKVKEIIPLTHGIVRLPIIESGKPIERYTSPLHLSATTGNTAKNLHWYVSIHLNKMPCIGYIQGVYIEGNHLENLLYSIFLYAGYYPRLSLVELMRERRSPGSLWDNINKALHGGRIDNETLYSLVDRYLMRRKVDEELGDIPYVTLKRYVEEHED